MKCDHGKMPSGMGQLHGSRCEQPLNVNLTLFSIPSGNIWGLYIYRFAIPITYLI